jgi:site-specific recombinase XerD
MTGEDYQRAADLPAYAHTRVPAGRHIQHDDLAAVLAGCDKDRSPAGRRDGAMLATLYSTGCRRAEVAGLTLADFDGEARSLRVRGKGDKERLVYLTEEAVQRLELWLSVRGRASGPLFCPINKAGRLRMSHMTGQAIADIVSRRLTSASVAKRTPHDFRRTFIGELLDAGVDLATTQALVGHASPATTARYDRRPERRRREAVDRLRIPGNGSAGG